MTAFDNNTTLMMLLNNRDSAAATLPHLRSSGDIVTLPPGLIQVVCEVEAPEQGGTAEVTAMDGFIDRSLTPVSSELEGVDQQGAVAELSDSFARPVATCSDESNAAGARETDADTDMTGCSAMSAHLAGEMTVSAASQSVESFAAVRKQGLPGSPPAVDVPEQNGEREEPVATVAEKPVQVRDTVSEPHVIEGWHLEGHEHASRTSTYPAGLCAAASVFAASESVRDDIHDANAPVAHSAELLDASSAATHADSCVDATTATTADKKHPNAICDEPATVISASATLDDVGMTDTPKFEASVVAARLHSGASEDGSERVVQSTTLRHECEATNVALGCSATSATSHRAGKLVLPSREPCELSRAQQRPSFVVWQCVSSA